MIITKIKKTHNPIFFKEESEILSNPFIITTGYLRLVTDAAFDEPASVYVDIGNTPTVAEYNGYLINQHPEIIKIQAPKKFIGAKIFPNAHQTTISFVGNGLTVDNPFLVGEYVTITNAIDDRYNLAINHIKIAQRTKDLINLDIDLSDFTELNHAVTINLSTRIAVRSYTGSGLLNVSEIHPVN